MPPSTDVPPEAKPTCAAPRPAELPGDCGPVAKKPRKEDWRARAQLNEYESCANPSIPEIPVRGFPASTHESGPTAIHYFDTSAEMAIEGRATTPNLLAAYVRIRVGESVETSANCTSSVFYVIRGSGTTTAAGCEFDWSTGDLFAIPGDGTAVHTCAAAESHGGAAFYWVTDEPLLEYLGVRPTRPKFEPIFFDSESMRRTVEAIRHGPGSEHKNRVGILLSSPATPQTKTLTHTLWSLLNVLPHQAPQNVQRPHRHNSVALDLCVYAKPGTCYTLMGPSLDRHGNIVDPVRCDWASGSAFITPPGWWHSHHNEGDEDSWVLPIQDAGWLTHARILDIRFVDEEVERIKLGVARGASYKSLDSLDRNHSDSAK